MSAMSDPTDRYLLGAFLPDAERRELEASAAGNPEAEAMLRASGALREMIGDFDALRQLSESGDALAFLAAMRLTAAEGEADWSALLDRLERRVLERPGARAEYDRLRARIEELERTSDAEAHFTRLTGGRPPRVLPLRSLLAAAAVILAVIAAAVTGRIVEDPVARAAHDSVRRSAEAGPLFRSGAGPATRILRDAERGRRLVLGIWPVYDRSFLHDLDRRLGDPGTAAEWFLIARIRLMAGQTVSGELALREAVRRGAGAEAESLLTKVEGLRDRTKGRSREPDRP